LDIRQGTLTFYIKADQHFIELYNAVSGINYAIIILPTGATADSFSTMRQAKLEGAKVFPAGSMGIAIEWRRQVK
jgi:hypothetical protein